MMAQSVMHPCEAKETTAVSELLINRKHALKWLFYHRGPRRRRVPLWVGRWGGRRSHLLLRSKVYVYSETALVG